MAFDYQKKIWGSSKNKFSISTLQYLKLKWFTADVQLNKESLLDLGCGIGNLTAALKKEKPSLKVTGIDINKKAIKKANTLFPQTNFLKADISNLPFKNNTFEIITGFDILEHLSNPKKVLKEVYRILKKGGIVHFSTPLEGQPGTLYWLLSYLNWHGKEKYAGHQQKFSRSSFLKLIKKSGFKIINQRFSFHFFGQLLDVLFYLFLAKKMKRGLEEEIDSQSGIKKTIFNSAKNILVTASNLESLLLQRLTGGCIHLTAYKK